ncbi:MAG: DNA circularization protein [Gammaproteobacteria bacterium]
MAWLQRYQSGKFRGAPFVTEGHDLAGGRRLHVHEYPKRDTPLAEDLGRAAESFQLELFVRGPDYMAARDALLEALRAEGPGTLVHPYLGTMRVAVARFRMREGTREGGIARFMVDFVEAGELTYPTQTKNTGAIVASRADAAQAAVAASFPSAYTVDNHPEFVADSALATSQAAIAQLQALAGAGPALATQKTAYLRGLAGSLATLASTVRTPASLAADLQTQVAGLAALWPSAGTRVDRYRPLYTFGSTLAPPPATTPSRVREGANQVALTHLVRQSAVIEATRASREVPFESYQEAAALREELAERLDTEMLIADDQVYPALADLRVAMIRDITARGADLARVTTWRPPATLPALVVAHRLYGDAREEAAVLARNSRTVRHPGFVPGGQALEVLTYA